MRSIIVESCIGVGSTNLGALNVGDFSRGQAQNKPHVVSWGQSEYLVGSNVHEFATPRQRLDFGTLSGGTEQRALAYTALGLLLGPGEYSLSLYVGLPVEVQEKDDLARRTRRSVRGWLEGQHKYILNGEEIELDIQKVGFLTQPVGTFLAWGLDNDGNWRHDNSLLRDADIAIGDIGFNTFDYFVVSGGKVGKRYTGGKTAGVRRMIEQVAERLQNRYGAEYTISEINRLIREDNPSVYLSDGRVDLTELIEEARVSAAGNILRHLNEKWGNGRQFAKILFTGGGARLFYDELISQYPTGEIMPSPVIANAVGFAKYGQSKTEGLAAGLDIGFGNYKCVTIR